MDAVFWCSEDLQDSSSFQRRQLCRHLGVRVGFCSWVVGLRASKHEPSVELEADAASEAGTGTLTAQRMKMAGACMVNADVRVLFWLPLSGGDKRTELRFLTSCGVIIRSQGATREEKATRVKNSPFSTFPSRLPVRALPPSGPRLHGNRLLLIAILHMCTYQAGGSREPLLTW